MPLHCSCMVDRTSLVWRRQTLYALANLSGRSPCLRMGAGAARLVPAYMERQDTKTDIFAIHSTCMEISVSLSCLFVHEPPYQTTVVCCNPVFHHGRSHMDHPAVFTCFPHKCGARSGSPQLAFYPQKPIIKYSSSLLVYIAELTAFTCGICNVAYRYLNLASL